MKSLCFFILFLFSLQAYSQNENIAARLTIKRGNHVDFVFNSFSKYENGITLNNYTVIQIYYKDTAVSPPNPVLPNLLTKWKLSANALTDKMNGDGGNNLDLDVLELTATGAGTSAGKQALVYENPGDGVELITDGPQNAAPMTVQITYDCGTGSKKLMNKMADYYIVDIEFTLIEQ